MFLDSNKPYLDSNHYNKDNKLITLIDKVN